ncbi:mucolipin-2 isoform X2 [Mastomys coucha]|uniref:mucolipin-2 isoform X2 n=1 Tax=Mastomys coucha TaxID=35658 RepID=UPI0012622317|nr:mucolipin-2 isoform X2 [Mastomys coucha]
MPGGEETLDLPAWNRAPDPAWGPHHSSVMASLDSEVKEECLREDLKFYFMSPCEKYRARRQIPWKLGLQILKIVMVTTQLVRFGLGNQLVVAFKEDNTVAFKHLFLKGFSGIDEDDYSCSIYTQEDAYQSIFFAIKQYRHLKDISLATLGYGESEDNRTGLRFCKQHYKTGAKFSSNETLNIDSDIETDCIHLDLQALTKEPEDWAQAPFFRLDFYRLVRVDISFALKGIDLQAVHSREVPDCYLFQNKITFDNTAHSGKIKIYLNSEANIEECKNMNISGSTQRSAHYVLVFDVFVILICLASLILCTRSIVLALRLRKRFLNFFLEKYKQRVCDADQWEFINGWYVLVTISDLMTILGSILKMEIKAKFENLNIVAECLFSLVNGDDMFATFAQIQQKSILVWLFSRLYLYSFISLFIYMVLSLFIALITDSYHTIKKYQQNGFPETDLQKFLKESRSKDGCQKEPSALLSCFCCLRRGRSNDHLILID